MRLQLPARLCDLGEELFVFGQEVVHVAGAGVGVVRVLEVEVEVPGLDLVDGNAPGKLAFLALALLSRFAPPLFLDIEFLDTDRFGFVVALHAGRIGVFVIPDVLGRLAFGEEQEVGLDAGVGGEDAVGQTDNGVQVALLQQFLLDARLDAFAEQRAVGQHDGAAATLAQEMDNEHEEKVGGFLGAIGGGKILLGAVLFHAAERRVGHDDVHAVVGGVTGVGPGKRVVVADFM